MRKLISIICIFLLLLQAIPVLHFFAEQKADFYAYVDEEKPEQKTKPGAEDLRQDHCKTHFSSPVANCDVQPFSLLVEKPHVPPSLEFLTPPPDAGS